MALRGLIVGLFALLVPMDLLAGEVRPRSILVLDQSDMRGIKHGWYALEDDGNLSSGPFSCLEDCVKRITQPTNGTMASKLQPGPS